MDNLDSFSLNVANSLAKLGAEVLVVPGRGPSSPELSEASPRPTCHHSPGAEGLTEPRAAGPWPWAPRVLAAHHGPSHPGAKRTPWGAAAGPVPGAPGPGRGQGLAPAAVAAGPGAWHHRGALVRG